MKKTLSIFFFLCFSLYVMAQSPFSAESVKKEKSKINLSLGYGFLPINTNNWWANQFVKSHPWYSANGKSTTLHATNLSNSGAVNFAIGIDVSPLIEIGIPFTWSRSYGYFDDISTNFRSADTYHDDWLSLTPNVKFNWFRHKNLTLYSRVGIGFSLVNRIHDYDNHNPTASVAFAWQLSPIGIEYGNTVCIYAEGGFGQLGTAVVGVKFRFNKATHAKSDGFVEW
ncbi:MAG: hypothetical protein RSC07_02795 [Mucinivorans sp.]